jgi:hypothetical protein
VLRITILTGTIVSAVSVVLAVFLLQLKEPLTVPYLVRHSLRVLSHTSHSVSGYDTIVSSEESIPRTRSDFSAFVARRRHLNGSRYVLILHETGEQRRTAIMGVLGSPHIDLLATSPSTLGRWHCSARPVPTVPPGTLPSGIPFVGFPTDNFLRNGPIPTQGGTFSPAVRADASGQNLLLIRQTESRTTAKETVRVISKWYVQKRTGRLMLFVRTWTSSPATQSRHYSSEIWTERFADYRDAPNSLGVKCQ